MKKITELTELEILYLKDSEIELMIKLRKAEEGIKLTSRPKQPEYFTITPPDLTIYMCNLFGDALVCESIEELNQLINLIKGFKSTYLLEYDWNKTGSDVKYASKNFKKTYSGEWHVVSSKQVYSIELYSSVIDMIAKNKKAEEEFSEEIADYESIINEAKWIEDEINNRVLEVREKYYRLNNFCRKFKDDYLPLANNNKKIAMSFLSKAYSLTEGEKEYVLSNYNNI